MSENDSLAGTPTLREGDSARNAKNVDGSRDDISISNQLLEFGSSLSAEAPSAVAHGGWHPESR